MKLIEPDAATLDAATAGDLEALERLLRALQPGVYNLAVRVLGHRDDAADATQEILLKVVTHLGGFRGESAFTTWVFRVAHNHLLTARTRARESPEVSFDALAEKLEAGLDFAATSGAVTDRALTPEEKAAAREVALSCTQGMLMALDREQRLAYVLDLAFGLDSPQAAAVLGVTAAAYRQRLARARARLSAFTGRTCGLVNPDARCRCEKQLPVLGHLQRQGTPVMQTVPLRHAAELAEAERAFDSFVRLSDAAALLRAHPAYQAPEAMLDAIRDVLRAEGYRTSATRVQ